MQVAKLPIRNVRNDNFLQRLLVTWVYAIVNAGRRGKLQQEALCMPADQAAEAASEKFLKQWAHEKEDAAASAAAVAAAAVAGGARGTPQQPSLGRALRRSFGWEFALAGVFKLLWSGFVLLGASYFVNVSQTGQHQPQHTDPAFMHVSAPAHDSLAPTTRCQHLAPLRTPQALIEYVQGKFEGADALPDKGVGWVSTRQL